MYQKDEKSIGHDESLLYAHALNSTQSSHAGDALTKPLTWLDRVSLHHLENEIRLTRTDTSALCQAGKVYVQDRLRETGKRVWDLLQEGAHFYVCGDAAFMATAVEETLLDIIAQHQARTFLCLQARMSAGLYGWVTT